MGEARREEVVQVPVDEIWIPEDRVTSVLDTEIEEELEKSIRQHGILQPLQIALVNGKYVLIDGLHRLRVAKKLGMRTVPAIVKPMSEDQLLITNLIVNRQRGRSNPAEEAKVLKKLVDEYGYDFDKAAELLGMSRATADKYYRIATNCTDKVLEYLGAGLISVGCAHWLSYLENKEKQDELVEYFAKWKYTVEQCKSAVLAEIKPEVPTPYIITETGEPKPRPIPVYPCGKEVDPTRVVVIQFDADVWPMVKEALDNLCREGFFYGEEVKATEEVEAGATPQAPQPPQQPQQPPPQQPAKKRDWFLEALRG